jgi:hypothetical protein
MSSLTPSLDLCRFPPISAGIVNPDKDEPRTLVEFITTFTSEPRVLMADEKAMDSKDAKFPKANDANLEKGAKAKDGSEVDLDCPPIDLP